MSKKKKNSLSSGLAILLAAVMLLLGATFAHRTVTSQTVVNTFGAQVFDAQLYETTGSEYDITSNGSSKKDPTVEVTVDTDAYVYVKVDANDYFKGHQVILWDIVGDWSKLEGVDNVYYQAIEAGSHSLPVLMNDQVSYAFLSNEDLLAISNLTGEDKLQLSFTAYAIESEPFATAKDAWNGVENTTFVATAAALQNALNAGETNIALMDDIEVAQQIEITGSVTIEGNGHTIINTQKSTTDYEGRILNIANATDEIEVNISNLNLQGTKKIDGADGTVRGISFFGNEATVTLNMDNVNLTGIDKYAIHIGNNSAAPIINVSNSTIQGWCAIQTYTAETEATFTNCTLIGINEQKYSEEGWNNFATIYFAKDRKAAANGNNIAGDNSTITLDNCVIEANSKAGCNYEKIVQVEAVDCNLILKNGTTFTMNGASVDTMDKETYSFHGSDGTITYPEFNLTIDGTPINLYE